VFEPPRVLSAQGLLDKAFRRASKATTAKGRTREERTKNLAIAKVQAAGDVLATTLESYIKGFPSLDRIPPFYQELIEATIGLQPLRKNLAAADWARKKALELARGFARRIQAARGATAVGAIRREAFGRLSSVINQIAPNLEALASARRPLKGFPDINPEAPTIVVAGYPNVGKSAFVGRVSTAKPRVAPYPFTTQGVFVGHFDVGYTRFQILDTPGLLDRPMDARNPMERQAITALAHVADAVVFLVDPSETCGYDLSSQMRLLDTVRELFPDVSILVVENKSDLGTRGLGRPAMSTLTGSGVEKVLAEAVRLATSSAPASVPRARAG
jgi:nucleolar GTP-binding protein